ncbi:MAG TPA: hypothetical protein VHK91_01430, partial [Flavisolibacter sp.]|nr:hypothetical protein [Flavisolibacter sp.]
TIESYLDQVPIIPDPENFTTVPERSSIEYRKEVARYNRLWNVVVWFLLAGAAAFCYWANRYRKKFIRDNTVDGVFIAPDSYYLSNGYHSDSSGSSSGFGGFGGSDGGGFSGGGASDSW